MAFTKALRTSAETIYAAWGKFNDLIDDLLSAGNGKGASQIGVEDSGGKIAATNVETAIAEMATAWMAKYTAGEALTQYQVCYVSANNTMSLADASATSTALVRALVMEDVTSASTGRFLVAGEVTNTSWSFTANDVIFLSTTAGSLTATPPSASGEVVIRVGLALSPTKIVFQPELFYTVI